MAKRKAKGLVRNVCSVCGKEFFSKQKAQFCVDNSTCRVKAHQEKVQKDKLTKSLMMDLDAYRYYAQFVEHFPQAKAEIDILFLESGKEAMSQAITLAWKVADILRGRVENDLHPTQ